jgi:hypothetical protein
MQQGGAENGASPPRLPVDPAIDDLAKDVHQDAFVEPEKLVRIVTRVFIHRG